MIFCNLAKHIFDIMRKGIFFIVLTSFLLNSYGQDYYYKDYAPFDAKIPTPEQFLGYKIGTQHTRYDRIVDYFKLLARLSSRASFKVYGKTHENRPLVMLYVSQPDNLQHIDSIRDTHYVLVTSKRYIKNYFNLPVFINLGFNVHGNEASASEAALLVAYTLVASQRKEVQQYLKQAVFFIDPTLNPDGRERHSEWVNAMKSKHLVADPLDIEHTETWPTGRTNHYWFDLNRDWLLAIHPESQAKLQWFHHWYPNIVTDFHEMRTSDNTFFYEPEKISGLLKPLAPKGNEALNILFAKAFSKRMESLGTYYFTHELFDATYPGYGSSYADLQGGLALLFEQTGVRGHLKKMHIGTITFSYAIRNQYAAAMTTIQTAVSHKDQLYKYQQEFFKNAVKTAKANPVKTYIFSVEKDQNRLKAFIKLLKYHDIKVYENMYDVYENGAVFLKHQSYFVPTEQNQYKMVQSIFETHTKMRDSVYYDASAWSLANAYDIHYKASSKHLPLEKEVQVKDFERNISFQKADYAYIIPWTDYNAPSLLYALQDKGIILKALTKERDFSIAGVKKHFLPGTLVLPLSHQSLSSGEIYDIILKEAKRLQVPVIPVLSGQSGMGINLGARTLISLRKPKVLLWVGQGVSNYEAGEVWYQTDVHLGMPVTKVMLHNFNRVDLNAYNTMVMVSGNYALLGTKEIEKIKAWVAQGNTLILSRNANSWAIRHAWVNEHLLTKKTDSVFKRIDYGDYYENKGKEYLGGAIFMTNLDTTHPIGYGFTHRNLPVYKNSSLFLKPSKNPYRTVSVYTKHALVDGYISKDNYEILNRAASIIISPIGKGRVVMFANNPLFRASWFGTHKLFYNALFFGNHIKH